MQEISEVSESRDHSYSLCVWNGGTEINPCKSVQAFLLLSKKCREEIEEYAECYWDFSAATFILNHHTPWKICPSLRNLMHAKFKIINNFKVSGKINTCIIDTVL